jgi:hypothetical protein
MDPFVRFRGESRAMAALRLVPPPSDEAEGSLTYVVSRTALVSPGTPYVIAALIDPSMAGDYRFAEAEVYSETQMREDPSLLGALRDWESGDRSLFTSDREAHDQVEAAYRASILRSAQRHPSMLARA